MTLDRYLLRQLCLGMAFAVAAMAFIAVPGILVQAFHKLAGVGMGSILGFLPLALIDLLPYLLPIGFLLAVVATFGRMAADNEWTALLMAGIHPLRVLAPAALLALVLSGVLYVLSSEVSPKTSFRQRDYTKGSVVRLLRSLSPGRTGLKFGSFYLKSRARDPLDRSRFEQVFIHVPKRGDEPAQLIYAAAARFHVEESTMEIELTWPRWIGQGVDARGARARVVLDLDQLFEVDAARGQEWRYQSSGELRRRLDRSEALIASDGLAALGTKTQAEGYVRPADLNKVRFELHARRALAAVCPMFLLLGVATGLFLRRGSQLFAFAAAVLYALVYYLLSMRLGKGLVNSAAAPQWIAAWGATMVGSSIGAFMCWRALRR